MKVISWNIRGCGNPRKWKALDRKIKQENPDILFLQETKCSSESMDKISNKIWKRSRVMALDAAGQSGGIAILCNPQIIDLSNWRANKFSLSTDFQHLITGATGTLVNTYGPSNFAEKQAFLDFLEWTNSQGGGGHWIIGGDFNLISNLGEKKGGRRALDKFQEAFGAFQAGSSFVDMETSTGWFTWNNKRGGAHLVASRLDRFLVSESLLRDTGEILAEVLPAAGSDHWPICLRWDWTSSALGKPFRFEQFWMEHKDFKNLAQQWWQDLVPPAGTAMFRFQQNLKALKSKICTWNKEEFGNIFEDKKRLIADLEQLSQKGMTEGWDEDM